MAAIGSPVGLDLPGSVIRLLGTCCRSVTSRGPVGSDGVDDVANDELAVVERVRLAFTRIRPVAPYLEDALEVPGAPVIRVVPLPDPDPDRVPGDVLGGLV